MDSSLQDLCRAGAAALGVEFPYCLSGLVIHQLKNPGAPFIYGGSAPAMDMRTALCSYGSPELQLVRGLQVSPATLAVDLIEKVGPGGNFFAEEHTVEHFRESLYLSNLPNRLEFARWQQEGARDFRRRANEKVQRLLQEHRPPPLPPPIEEAVRAVSRQRDLR